MFETLFLLSPSVINVFLIFAYFKWRKKYQWTLGRFLKYIFFGGVIGFFIAIVFVVTWTLIYNGSQGLLSIIIFGPIFFTYGEFAGFALLLRVNSQKQDREKMIEGQVSS